MAKMGNYCKAYPLKRFREFSGWTENLANLRKDRVSQEVGADNATPKLKDDDFLYLQENFVVTDGVFIDENIIYEQAPPEWEEFCKINLEFVVPDYTRAKDAGAEVG
jgi:hypothetical protein